MAGHRPDFEDRSQIKRQKRRMAHTDEPRDEEEDSSASADEEGGGVPVSSYQSGKQVKVKDKVSSISPPSATSVLPPPVPIQSPKHARSPSRFRHLRRKALHSSVQDCSA